MEKQLSFTKNEQRMLPEFRQKLNIAESNEDVKKFFSHMVKKLFESIFSQKTDIIYGDITLTPGHTPYFNISERLLESEEFSSIWNHSDLPKIIGRFSKSATNRYQRLEKHPEKTDAKIRMSG